jgi:hypothetical protein
MTAKTSALLTVFPMSSGTRKLLVVGGVVLKTAGHRRGQRACRPRTGSGRTVGSGHDDAHRLASTFGGQDRSLWRWAPVDRVLVVVVRPAGQNEKYPEFTRRYQAS